MILLLFFCSLILFDPNFANSAVFTPPDTTENVHALKQCSKCHKSAKPTSQADASLLTENSVQLCGACHVKPAFMHATPEIKPPISAVYKEFPLEKKSLLGCSTCHEEPECRNKKTAVPKLLRGGPYKKKDDFCFRCHHDLKITATQVNPHFQRKEMLDTKQSIQCMYCHTVDPSLTAPTFEKPLLKLPYEKLCLICHPAEVHPLANEHLSRKLTKERATAISDMADKKNVHLPLGTDFSITCATCHAPHSNSCKPDDKSAGCKRSRARSNTLCTSCHVSHVK